MKRTVYGQEQPFFRVITDLTVTEVYGKGAGLQWTSTQVNVYQNEIDYYLVIANGVEIDRIPSPKGDFETTADKQIITTSINLNPETFYEVWLHPVDINGNQGYKSNTVTLTTPTWETFLFDNFTNIIAIYGLKKLATEATAAVRIKRTSDNAETDVLFPSSGFISLTSSVSAGGDLGTWIGSGTAEIITIYDQRGANNLSLLSGKGYATLIESGTLNTDNNIPIIKLYRTGGSGTETQWGVMFGKANFNGIASGVNTPNTTVFQVANYQGITDGSAPLFAFNEAFDNTTATKQKVLVGSGAGVSFYGSRLDGSLASANRTIRTTIRLDWDLEDYVNGVNNIADSQSETLKGTTFGLAFHNANSHANFIFTGCAVAMADLRGARRLIENELNIEFNTYTTLES